MLVSRFVEDFALLVFGKGSLSSYRQDTWRYFRRYMAT